MHKHIYSEIIYVNNNDVIIRTYGKFNNDIVQSESSCVAALTYLLNETLTKISLHSMFNCL